MNGNEYLGSLWKRRDALLRKYGWPEDDENGDPWVPEERLDAVPEDYAAWEREFGAKADAMEAAAFRAVCVKYGVPEVADLRETRPEEFGRRLGVGQRQAAKEAREGDK